jgi:hypothetical protein
MKAEHMTFDKVVQYADQRLKEAMAEAMTDHAMKLARRGTPLHEIEASLSKYSAALEPWYKNSLAEIACKFALLEAPPTNAVN